MIVSLSQVVSDCDSDFAFSCMILRMSPIEEDAKDFDLIGHDCESQHAGNCMTRHAENHHVFLVMRVCLIFAARCPIVNESAYTWASGTSMAVPHVAGLAAIYLSNRPQAQPAEVKLAILNAATQNQLNFSINSVLPGTPNLLINSVAVSSQGIVTASQGPWSEDIVSFRDSRFLFPRMSPSADNFAKALFQYLCTLCMLYHFGYI